MCRDTVDFLGWLETSASVPVCCLHGDLSCSLRSQLRPHRFSPHRAFTRRASRRRQFCLSFLILLLPVGGRLHRLIGDPEECDHSTVHVVYDMVLFLEFFFFSFCFLWEVGLTLGRGGGCFTLQLKVLLQMLDLFVLLHEATSGLCSIYITEWHELFLLMLLQTRLIATVSLELSLREVFGTLLFQSVTNEAHHCIESSKTDIYRILRWFHRAILNQNHFIVPWRTHRRQGDNVTLRKSFSCPCQHPISTAWGERLKFIGKWRIKKTNRTCLL